MSTGTIVGIAIWLLMAFYCAMLAKIKGKSAVLFFFLGLILPFLMIIILYFIKPRGWGPKN